jgi:tubulin beta
VARDEHGVGGEGKYCDGNDAQLGRIDLFYHEASGGKYVPARCSLTSSPA